MFFDIVIKNGCLVDGTGASPYIGDIGIKEDKIISVGSTLDESALAIDAKGSYVVPGFIDTHSHADCSAFLYPDCESYLHQGITTFIGGQCGDSNAPIFEYWIRKYWEYDIWNDIDPFVYNPRTIQPVNRVLGVVSRKMGYEIKWRSFGEYASVLENTGLGCNMIPLAGHSQIRADVMGPNCARKPTESEMRRMKEHLEEALESGAWGFSTGRDYPPSAYADITELEELARYVRNLGGYYFTHWRRTGIRVGTPARPDKLAGIVEALEIALSCGIKTQVSHLSTGFDIYPENSRMDEFAAQVTLGVLDEYIARGADVAFDVIPGESGGICINPYLASFLMPWIKQAGSLKQFVVNLRAYDYREKLIAFLEGGGWYALNPIVNVSWDKKIEVLTCYGDPSCVGRTIRDIARVKGLSPMETVMHLLDVDPMTRIRKRDKSEAEVRGLLRHSRGFVCTDTYAFDLVGTYGAEGEFPEILPHPHTYCAFPKYILLYGPDKIEDIIHKITGAPAEFMGIKNRGILKKGSFADIVVLNREKLRTNESYVEPRVYPEGVEYVLVNGELVLEKGHYIGRRAGRLLKK